ncbi:glycoside hydrolase family 25 protein [Streptomyces sp. 8L]|uniref:glycoside hydrolase family 25 protein n=1 Tax=Streptomyces sp. 8L TaxID=2877242 RepID=UPI001CD36249|nr:glycoside hydrolase family 25 protein [Streptomyces sp. 8L]MCA1220610.1 glycoside hydrolase family 25 protein [Streptomyces sp. 8L]
MAATSRGVDVSAYQGVQDWAAHKAEGVAFGFAKASEGEHTHDSRFATHIKGIKGAGLVPGAYHFAWPNQPASVEAANYVAAVKSYAGKGFCHWLDLERYSDGRNYAGRSAAQIKAYATDWLAAVRKAFPGQRVGVYTSGDDLAKGHVPSGVPLWYPAYTWGTASVSYAKAEAAARPHPSGQTPLFWQFTSTPLDRSLCYLSATALRAWAAGTDAPEDDMPQFVNLGLAEPYTIAPGKDWDAIEFTKEYTDETGDHSPGGSVFVRGSARFSGQVSLTLEGAPAGAQIQVRQSEVDAKGAYVLDHPITEIIATEGATFGTVPLTNHLPAGHGMRIRVKAFQSTPLKVTAAVVKALVWKG